MTPRKIELFIEKIIYASRWVMAPVYLGMSLVLFAIAIKFFQELFYVLPKILDMSVSALILKLLTLIDLILVSSLTIIVMFSGYENFVSQMDMSEDTEKLDWLGSHDYGSLKMKVASSIVAISSIHLLKVFMNIEEIDNEKIMWYVLIHLTMVISALLMGYLDKLSRH